MTPPTAVASSERRTISLRFSARCSSRGPAAAGDTSTGSITIDVKHSNYHGRLLKNKSLTFTLTAKSKVTFRHKSTLAEGQTARGVIVVRAPKKITGDIVTELPSQAKRIHVLVLKNLP